MIYVGNETSLKANDWENLLLFTHVCVVVICGETLKASDKKFLLFLQLFDSLYQAFFITLTVPRVLG